MTLLESTLKFFGFTEDDEDTNDSSTVIHHVSQNKPNIHNLHQQQEPKFEIRISFPRIYEDSKHCNTFATKQSRSCKPSVFRSINNKTVDRFFMARPMP